MIKDQNVKTAIDVAGKMFGEQIANWCTACFWLTQIYLSASLFSVPKADNFTVSFVVW